LATPLTDLSLGVKDQGAGREAMTGLSFDEGMRAEDSTPVVFSFVERIVAGLAELLAGKLDAVDESEPEHGLLVANMADSHRYLDED